MCGIAGYFGPPNAQATRRVRQMLASQAHRGPDGAGMMTWRHAAPWRASYAAAPHQLPADAEAHQCVLGHNLLAIQDPTPAARQPMIRGEIAIAFNGEIYNYVELREELLADGATFTSRSDTEVLLKLWQRDGPACLPKLRGMFAFAILDRGRGSLWLARDPLGIKPLYITRVSDGGHWFSSEIRALHAGGIIKRELDDQAALASVAAGINKFGETQTLYKQVDEVPPGTWMLLDSTGQTQRQRYYDLPPLVGDLEGEPAETALRAEFMESVRLHLRASRRIATCLSGGLDSTHLAWAIARHLRAGEGSQPLRAYTIHTASAEQSELALAQDVTRAAGLPHVLVADPSDIAPADVLEMIVAYEVPNHVIGPINQFLLLQQVSNMGDTVVLDGQGGDELMSGYPWYAPVLLKAIAERGGDSAPFAAAYRGHAPLPEETARQFERMFHDPAAWISAFMWQGNFLGHAPEEILALPQTQYYLAGGGDWAPFRERQYLRAELQYLLRQEDRLGMWFGLECRVPFVDVPLIALVARLSPQWLLKDGYLKFPLRILFPDLPETVRWNTRKRGFWETDVRRFGWINQVGRRLAADSPVIRRLFPSARDDWEKLSFDQHWRLLQLAVLERAATRQEAHALL